MPRRRKDEDEDSEESLAEEEEEEEQLVLDDEHPTIEPYEVLNLERTATADQIKSAYRKAALKHHPDKSPEHLKSEAHAKFQEVAFAYAILSDPIRRQRYDATGSTAESLAEDGDFSWASFYSDQFRDVVTEDAIEEFTREYKGSQEEIGDLLRAYTKCKGKWSGIYQIVMLSHPVSDENRFRRIIDEAIGKGVVENYPAYANETQKQKDKRMRDADKEADEAEEYVKEKGLGDKLKAKRAKKDDGLGALAALIQKKNAGQSSFLDQLEAKYAGDAKKSKKGKGKGKRKALDEDDEDGEPDEEAFQAAAARLKINKAAAMEGRNSKRTKS